MNLFFFLEEVSCNSALAENSHKILPNFLGMTFLNYRKLYTGTRSIMPLFANLDEDMISIDNCEKETLPISKIFLMNYYHGIYVRIFGTKFGICQIHVWFTSLFNCNEQFPKSVRSYCISILKYYSKLVRLVDFIVPQLIKILKTLFLKTGPVWYSNCINLNHTLRLIIEASSRLPKKELQSHLYFW
ncbi:hypothetical protein ALC57_12724 [Trachymyrmex cornetzi]|uniref:Uncharacterized protein n=1 Tax=Trachymyrmex cornetzi TaxID=471704 RepID=A0A151J0R4_9HYME|nr:hypothetical protein ALC57_12724 [Trachymyrmex cornetzi]